MKGIVLIGLIFLFAGCSHNKTTYSGHGGDSLDSETIKKFAPPVADPVIAGRVRSMLEIDAPSLGVISDEGNELFFNWKVTGDYHVWKVSGPLNFPQQMTGGSESAFLVGVGPDGKKVYLSRDSKGDEYTGIYSQDSSGGELVEIYRKEKVKASLQYISSDNKTLYLKANAEDPNNFSLYKYDLETKKNELLINRPGYWFLAEEKIKEDGSKIVLIGRMKTNICSEYFSLDLKTKAVEPILGQEDCEEYRVKFSAKDNEYIVQTNKFEEYRQLYLYSLKGGKPKWRQLTHGKNEVSYFSMDRQKTRIHYGINDNGYYRAKVIRTSDFKPLWFPSFKEADHVYFGVTSYNGRFTTLGVETATAPKSSYVYDWKTNSYRRWVLPRSPEVETSDFVKDTLEYYEAEDGTKIPMFVTRSKECEKKVCPVIAKFHGGPESMSNPGFSPINQLYVREGYIVVEPNVRGSYGYGKTWLNADNGPKRLKVLSDIRDCARWIKKNWAIDGVSPKVAIMGGSYGGYATLVGMTIYAGEYNAGVASVGMSSLVTFLQNTADYRRKLRESEYGYLDKDMDALQKLSPINYLDKIQSPILIFHGANDPRVPAGEAIQIFEKMEEKKIPGKLILFSDEGHGTRKLNNKVVKQAETLRFLNEIMK